MGVPYEAVSAAVCVPLILYYLYNAVPWYCRNSYFFAVRRDRRAFWNANYYHSKDCFRLGKVVFWRQDRVWYKADESSSSRPDTVIAVGDIEKYLGELEEVASHRIKEMVVNTAPTTVCQSKTNDTLVRIQKTSPTYMPGYITTMLKNRPAFDIYCDEWMVEDLAKIMPHLQFRSHGTFFTVARDWASLEEFEDCRPEAVNL